MLLSHHWLLCTNILPNLGAQRGERTRVRTYDTTGAGTVMSQLLAYMLADAITCGSGSESVGVCCCAFNSLLLSSRLAAVNSECTCVPFSNQKVVI